MVIHLCLFEPIPLTARVAGIAQANPDRKGIKDRPLKPNLEKGPSTNATALAKYPLSSNKSIPTNKIYT